MFTNHCFFLFGIRQTLPAERMGDHGSASRNVARMRWNLQVHHIFWMNVAPCRYIFKDSERAADIVHVEANVENPRKMAFHDLLLLCVALFRSFQIFWAISYMPQALAELNDEELRGFDKTREDLDTQVLSGDWLPELVACRDWTRGPRNSWLKDRNCMENAS